MCSCAARGAIIGRLIAQLQFKIENYTAFEQAEGKASYGEIIQRTRH